MKPLPALLSLALLALPSSPRSQESAGAGHPAGRAQAVVSSSVPDRSEWRPIRGGLELKLREAAGAMVLLP